jgi:DNA-binding response OmpR family regulator
MVITDMRMESDAAGREVIQAARTAAYHPAVALLTAFPDDDWADIGADKMLVKPMQTAILIRQIEKMLDTHSAKLQRLANSAAAPAASSASTHPTASAKKKSAAKRLATKKSPSKSPIARKKVATKKRKR